MEPNRTPQEIEEKGQWFKNLLHGAAGAYDQTLLGLPSWIASKVAPEATAKFKSQPGFRTGKNIGSFTGSIFGGAVPFIASMKNNPDARNFMAGVGNANLMGAPEWAAKKMEGKTLFGKELLPEGAVAGFKKEAGPAYPIGKVAGTIGSALVPVTGAKGMVSGLGQLGAGGMKALQGMKGLEAGWNATKLAKAAPVLGKMLLAGGKSAVENAAQGAMRAGFAGGDAGTVAKEAGLGALWGGVGAAGATGIGEGIKKLGQVLPRYVNEAKKILAGKFLSGATSMRGRNFQKALNFAAGPGAKGLGRMAKADDLLFDFADLVKGKGLGSPGKMEEYGRVVSDTFDAISDAAEPAVKGRKGLEIIGGLISPEQTAAIVEDYTDEVAQTAKKLLEDRLSKASGIRGTKKALGQLIDMTYSGTGKMAEDPALAGALRDYAKIARQGLNDLSIELAGPAGAKALADGGFKDARELFHTYSLLEPLSMAEAQGVGREIAKVSMGSNTATKLGLMGSGGMLGGAAAMGSNLEDETPLQKAGRVASSTLLGAAGSALLGKGVTKGLGSLYGAAKVGSASAAELAKGIPAFGEAVSNLAPAAGKLLSSGMSAARGAETAPQAPAFGPRPAPAGYVATPGGEKSAEQEGTEAGEALAAGDEDTYISKITDRIDSFWKTSGAEAMYPGQQAAFAQAVYQATDGFSPTKTAAILYQDPIERESYLNALKVNSAISPTFDQAANQPGALDWLPGIGENSDERLARESAEQSVLGAVSDVAPKGVPAKTIQGVVTKILSGRGSPLEKRKRLELVLKNYGVDFDLLRQAGVI